MHGWGGALLVAVLLLTAWGTVWAQTTQGAMQTRIWQLDDWSARYDFRLSFRSNCPLRSAPMSRVCQGEGRLQVFFKGRAEVLQRFAGPFQIWLKANGEVYDFIGLHAWSSDDKPQSPLRDFNLDGHEDLIIPEQRGRHIYLFDEKKRAFFPAPDELNALLLRNHPLWYVDAQNRRYETLETSDGCVLPNWSRTTVWQLADNRPVPTVRTSVDVGRCTDKKHFCRVEKIETFGDGQWRFKEKRHVPCLAMYIWPSKASASNGKLGFYANCVHTQEALENLRRQDAKTGYSGLHPPRLPEELQGEKLDYWDDLYP
jgi:hypothetical protein